MKEKFLVFWKNNDGITRKFLLAACIFAVVIAAVCS